MIVSSGNQVEYCFISEALEAIRGVRRIANKSVLPSGSCTARFNSTPGKMSYGSQEGAWTSLDDWFDDAPQIEMKEDVVGLGGYGKTLTVLFTDQVLNAEGVDDDEDW